MLFFKREPRYVLDSSSIIDGRAVHLFERKFIDGKVIIPTLVRYIVKKFSGNKGERAIKILQRNVSVQFIREKGDGLVEELCVLKVAQEKKAKVITTSDEICRQSRFFPQVSIIDIRDLYRILTPIFEPGRVITVKILKRGMHHNEGIGYIEGVKLIVEGAGKNINSTVTAKVNSMLTFETGNLVFCTIHNSGANIPGYRKTHSVKRNRNGISR